jgi:hypothetical protein
MKKKKIAITCLVILVVIFVVIQFIPVNLINPPIESDMPALPAVKAILKVSCYDCHSNETIWPWYSRVAPISWLLANDAKEGREKVNFSTWNSYTPEKQSRRISEAMDEIREGGMPPWYYTIKHTDAKITPDKLKTLEAWYLHYPKLLSCQGN